MHTHKCESTQGYTPTSISDVYIEALALNPKRLYSVRRLALTRYLRIRRRQSTVEPAFLHAAIPLVHSAHYNLDIFGRPYVGSASLQLNTHSFWP